MPRTRVGDFTIEYVTQGSDSAPALLLVMGTAAPLTMWDDELCDALAGRGFRVIRYDYRDTGRSSRSAAPMPASIAEMMQAFAAGALAPAYGLDDLAGEALGLLDALGIQRAQLLGMSQGAGVSQLVAARAPDRVAGLTLVATSTAGPNVPPPSPETMSVLMSDLPHDRESFVAWNELIYTRTGSSSPPPDVDWIRCRAERTWEQGWDRAGFLRHLLAVITAADRTPLLARVRAPTTIVQGDSDPVFSVAAAQQIAAAIPGARLRIVRGMGHDISPPFHATIADAVIASRP